MSTLIILFNYDDRAEFTCLLLILRLFKVAKSQHYGKQS